MRDQAKSTNSGWSPLSPIFQMFPHARSFLVAFASASDRKYHIHYIYRTGHTGAVSSTVSHGNHAVSTYAMHPLRAQIPPFSHTLPFHKAVLASPRSRSLPPLRQAYFGPYSSIWRSRPRPHRTHSVRRPPPPSATLRGSCLVMPLFPYSTDVQCYYVIPAPVSMILMSCDSGVRL